MKQVVSCVVFLACAAGCATTPSHPELGERLCFAFITCAVDAKFFEPVKQGMNDAAKMLDVECVFRGTEGVDLPAQAEMVRQAVKEGYDGIALNIIDPVAFDAVVEEAMIKGVPVVAFNVDDHTTPNTRLSAVNQRLYEAGVSLGRHVAPFVPEGSAVLLTMHDEGVSALEDRLRGLRDALKEKQIRETVVVTGNDSAKGAEVVAEALRAQPDIRVVLGTGQSDTEAAGLALEQHFPGPEYWSAGFDLSPATLRLILAGHIRCTVDQQPYLQGFYPVVQLAQYLRYGLKPPSIDAGAGIIDKSNAEAVSALSERKYR